MSLEFLTSLEELLHQRKKDLPEGSYTAKLFREGEDRYLKKIVEEAGETILAAKGGRREEIVYETADLFFHTILMLVDRGIPLAEVVAELERRHRK